MSGIRFVYFDIRGRGETTRLVLTASGQKWEDCRISFADWPKQKVDSPYGGLPYLEYKGKKYGQSMAIEIFLAKEHGLCGKDNLDLLRALEVINIKDDFIRELIKHKFEKDEAVKAELGKKLVEEGIPKFLGFFEKLLRDNGSKGFFIGSSLTVADLAVYDFGDTALVYNAKALDNFTEVRKNRAKVEQDPKIKAYLEARKKSDI